MIRVIGLWDRYGWIVWAAIAIWAAWEGDGWAAAIAGALAGSKRVKSRTFVDHLRARKIRQAAEDERLLARHAWLQARTLIDAYRKRPSEGAE